MSLLFMDSFDHYVTADLLEKYTSLTGTITIVSTPVRTGIGALSLNNSFGGAKNLDKNISSIAMGTAFIVGFAFRKSSNIFGGASSICSTKEMGYHAVRNWYFIYRIPLFLGDVFTVLATELLLLY
jgi:hypothetical protein